MSVANVQEISCLCTQMSQEKMFHCVDAPALMNKLTILVLALITQQKMMEYAMLVL